MSTRLSQVVFDANDHRALARFWGEVLGWPTVIDDPDEVEIGPGSDGDVPLGLRPGSRAEDTQEPRAHRPPHRFGRRLRCAHRTRSPASGRPGSTSVSATSRGVCLPIPRATSSASHRRATTPPTSRRDPSERSSSRLRTTRCSRRSGAQRRAGLVCRAGCTEVADRSSSSAAAIPRRSVRRTACTSTSRPDEGGDTQVEAERLISLGATRVDIGQGDVPWIVLADPEGNEFCVLTPVSA